MAPRLQIQAEPRSHSASILLARLRLLPIRDTSPDTVKIRMTPLSAFSARPPWASPSTPTGAAHQEPSPEARNKSPPSPSSMYSLINVIPEIKCIKNDGRILLQQRALILRKLRRKASKLSRECAPQPRPCHNLRMKLYRHG